MNLDETPQEGFTPADLEKYLEAYKPRSSYEGQWERLHPQILNLIRKAAPLTKVKARAPLSILGHLFADAAAFHFEGSLMELLTDEGIEPNRARLNATGVSLRTIHGVHSQLTHLHRILHDLPGVISGEPQRKVASAPFTLQDFEGLCQLLHRPTDAVELHITRRLILALGAGLIGAKGDSARIFFSDQGISAIIDGGGNRRPLSKKWITQLGALTAIDLELYNSPQDQATSGWLGQTSLPYLWPRLRDEWLLEQLDGSQSALLQMRQGKVTEYDLDRMQLRLNEMPIKVNLNILRNSQKNPQTECAQVSQAHYPHQDLNREV